VSTANSYRHGGKGDRPRAPLGQQQGREGRTLPPSMNPRKGMMKRKMKTERRGK
jgi:hypothetical protein